MYADISRSTFRPDRHYSAVIAQQGRVQLDADANEQAAIQLWLARTTAHDLIGPDGGPAGAAGFAVGPLTGSRDLDDLTIGGGRYYVDGILCDADRPGPGDAVGDDPDGDGADGGGAAEPEAPATWTYWDQPDGFRDPERPEDRLPGRYPYLMYLKVWERSVTAAEDPELREVALGSALPDTAARTKVVWQVLPLEGSALGLGEDPDKPAVREAFRTWAENERSGRPGWRPGASGRPGRTRTPASPRRTPATGDRRTSSTGWRSTRAARRARPRSSGPGRTAPWSSPSTDSTARGWSWPPWAATTSWT